MFYISSTETGPVAGRSFQKFCIRSWLVPKGLERVWDFTKLFKVGKKL